MSYMSIIFELLFQNNVKFYLNMHLTSAKFTPSWHPVEILFDLFNICGISKRHDRDFVVPQFPLKYNSYTINFPH